MTNRPLQIGALLRFALDEVRAEIYDAVLAAGFADVRAAHVTLFRWPGPEALRPSDLAAATQLSKQTVNGLLRDLEAAGYVELEQDPQDSRARIIRLTARGRRLQRVAVDAHAEIEKKWTRRVGTRRYAVLRDALADLVTAANA